MATATIEPVQITAGTSVAWTKSLSDYKATAGWVLTYVLRGNGALDKVATASGDDHAFALTAAETTGLAPGRYDWQVFAAKGAERVVVASGIVEVLPDLATATAGYDGRSIAEKTLDAIEATLAGKATADQQAMSINGRSIQRYTFSELIPVRDAYRRDVARERQAARVQAGKGGRRILTRFR